jgi:hypothetical protein
MQIIADGLLYDTATATRVHKRVFRGRNNDLPTRKFLYKTPNGRWFIHKTFVTNGEHAESIKVVSESFAKAWVRDRLAVDVYRTHFPLEAA